MTESFIKTRKKEFKINLFNFYIEVLHEFSNSLLEVVQKFLTFFSLPPKCKYLMNRYLRKTKKNWCNTIINVATWINDFISQHICCAKSFFQFEITFAIVRLIYWKDIQWFSAQICQ